MAANLRFRRGGTTSAPKQSGSMRMGRERLATINLNFMVGVWTNRVFFNLCTNTSQDVNRFRS